MGGPSIGKAGARKASAREGVAKLLGAWADPLSDLVSQPRRLLCKAAEHSVEVATKSRAGPVGQLLDRVVHGGGRARSGVEWLAFCAPGPIH